MNCKKVLFLEKTVILLLALCPILQHYKGLFVNAAVTTLVLVAPYTITRIVAKQTIVLDDVAFVFPLILYYFYRVFDHGTNIVEIGQAILISMFVISISSSCFDSKFFIRIITIISVLASICIILQYICYYIFHFHLQLVPTSLLSQKSNQWVLIAETGRASVTGRISRFYRPSAFFLEPSHMFIYMFTPLIFNLFSAKHSSKYIALLISVGMVLSTSGMGIIATIGIWIVYWGRVDNKVERVSVLQLLKYKRLFSLLFLLLVFVLMYLQIPFFRSSLQRITGSGNNYTNAITGRIKSGNSLIRQMKGIGLIFGVSDNLKGIEFNMSGFNSTMYRYGIIGIVFSYLFYIKGLLIFRGKHFWVSVVVIILSFFSSHTHSTMFVIYMTFVFVNGYQEHLYRKLTMTNMITDKLAIID